MDQNNLQLHVKDSCKQLEDLFSNLLEIFMNSIDHWIIFKVLNDNSESCKKLDSDGLLFCLQTKNAHQSRAISNLHMLLEKNQPKDVVCLDLLFQKLVGTTSNNITFKCELNSFFENTIQPEKKAEKTKLIAYRSNFVAHNRYIKPIQKNPNDSNLTIEDVDNLIVTIQNVFKFCSPFVHQNAHILNFDFERGRMAAEKFIALIKK